MYATLDDMITRYGMDLVTQVADRADPPAGRPDPDIVEAALDDAEETIHSYVAGRYAIPLSPMPEPVRRISCEIALYYLYAEGAPDEVRKRYEDAIAWLKDVAKGVVQLQAASVGPAAPATANGTVHAQGPARVFGAESMWGY